MAAKFSFHRWDDSAKNQIDLSDDGDDSYLSDERNDSLRAVLVHVWQVDLITEQHQPLAQLDGSEDHPVGSAAVLAVMIEGFQQQLWRGGAGKVQTNNLGRRNWKKM